MRPAQRRALQLDASAVALYHAELEDEVAGGGGVVMGHKGGVDLDVFDDVARRYSGGT